MSLASAFRYDGKRAVVVGGATGMGAAVAELVLDAGAEVVVMDYAEVTLPGAKAIHVNLGDVASIDAAIDECGGPVDALFSCAGVADGTPNLEKINFLGHRYMIDRLSRAGCSAAARPSASSPRPPASGGSRTSPSCGSTSPSPTSTRRRDGRSSTTTPTTCGASRRSAPTWRRRRWACSSRASASTRSVPVPTDTPLAQANKEMWLGFGADYRAEVGVEASTPLDQAYPLVFLCSDAAGVMTGQIVITDSGYFASGMTEVFPDATPTVNFLLGRFDRL